MAEFREYLVMLRSDPSDSQALAELQKLGPAVLGSPEAVLALDETRQQLRGKGASDTAVKLFDLELEHAEGERQAALLVGKGQVVFDDLLNADTSLECMTLALRLQPENEQVKAQLEHLEQVKVHWEQIVEKYIEEAEATTEPTLAATLYRAAAETFARYQPGASEVETYLRKAIEVDAKNFRAALQLARLFGDAERWQELRDLLQSCVEVADKPDVRIACWVRLADLAQGPLANNELAAHSMQRVVADDPGNARALAFLATMYEAQENWAAAVSLYANALKNKRRSGSAETEIDMLIQIGMLHWHRLEDAEAAEEYFARLRKISPAHRVQLDFYKKYYVQTEQAGKLMQLYRQALKSVGDADPERKRELMVELAQLSEGSMDNPEKAIDSWKSILRADPENIEASESLRRLYERTGKWNALLDLIKEQVEKLPADDAEGRVHGLLEVVEIYRDRLNLDVMVINTYNSILTLDASNLDVMDALAEKYRELGRWNDLIAVLSRKAQVETVEVEMRAALLSEVAALWIDRFGNYAQAIKPLEELLSMDASNAEALTRLKEIYTRRRQWRALIDLMGREALSLEDDARRAHYGSMAEIAGQKLGDSRLAINIWNQVLELPGSTTDPDDITPDAPVAYDALCALYEREKRYPALVEMLARKLALAVTPEAALPVLERMGKVYAHKLKAPVQAARVYQEVLALKPNHGKAARVLRELYAAAKDYDALESLYGGMGHWDDLVEAYFSISDKFEERADTVALLERAGRVAQENIGNPDNIARVYERLQSVEPNHLGAARALVPLYRDAGKWARLLSIHEILLDHAADDEKMGLIEDIRVLCENRLGSKSLAFQWTGRAYQLAPGDSELLSELKRLGAEADAWQEVSRILDERVYGDDASEDERVELFRELGVIAEQRLHQSDKAREYFQEILKLRSDDRQAMDALEELAMQHSEWPALLEILRERVALGDDTAEKVELLFKVAHIEEELQEDVTAAVVSYQAILEIEADNRRARRSLARIFEGLGDWAKLAESLEAEVRVSTDADSKASLYFRLGELYQGPLEREDEARESFKRCLALTPSQQVHDALHYFMQPGQASEVRVEVAGLLLPAFEQAEAHAKIAEAIEILVESATGEELLGFEARLANLYDGELNQPERAYAASARLLMLDPADAANRSRLDILGKLLDRAGDMRNKLEAAFEACDARGCDETVKLGIAMELAILCDKVLDDMEAAEVAWRRIQSLEEGHSDAHQALSRIFRMTEKWEDLRGLLQAKVERSFDVADRLRLYWQLAELAEGVLDDSGGAEAAFRGIIEAAPEQSRAFSALSGIYERSERWQEMEELLCLWSDYLEGAELSANDNRRARIRAEKLDQGSGAVDLAEELLARNGEDSEARAICESLLGDEGLRLRIARLLEPLYGAAGNSASLCRMLLVQAECAESRTEAMELYARIAELQDSELGDPGASMKNWLLALAKEPADERCLTALLRLAPLVDGWAKLAASLESAVDLVDEGDLSTRARLLRACADIHRDTLSQPAETVGLLERLLELDTSDPETIRYASYALDGLYASSSEFRKQARVLRGAAEWAEASEERKTLLARVAEIEETALEDESAALASWEAVLGEDPEDATALAACDRLLEASGAFRELADIVRRRVDLMELGQERADGLCRLAKLYGGKLEEPSEAISCYREILDLDVGMGAVLKALCELYRKESRFDDLLDILQRRVQESEGDARAALLFEAGVVLATDLSRPSDAVEHFADVLRLDVDHQAARERLSGFVSDPDLRIRAAELLDPLYEAGGDHAALISLLETLCEDNDDPRAVMSHLRRIAGIHEIVLEDSEAAFEVIMRAVKCSLAEPELPELLVDLQRLAAENGALPTLVDVYRDIAPDVFDGDLQRRIYLDIADLCRAVLQDVATAREYYQLVLDAQPDDERALRALEGIYRESEDHSALYELLVQKADLAANDIEKRAEALTEAGSLCAEHLDRTSDAAMHWEQVLELMPESRDVAGKLQELYAKAERWHDLAEALESRLGFAMTVEEAVELRYRLGALYEERIRDPDAAVESYGAAIGGDPNHQAAMGALERLLEEADTRSAVADILEPIHVANQDWPQLVRIYEIKLEAADDPSERLRITRYIARLHEDQLGDLGGAFHWMGRVFRESPSDKNVRMQLERLVGVLQNWEELAKVYQSYVDDEGGDSPELREVAETLADLYNKRLGQVDAAFGAYKRVLQMDPEALQVFSRTEAMLVRAESWGELIGLYEEVVHSSLDDERRQEIYAKLARVQEERLEDHGKATDGWRALLEIDPDSELAMGELDRLLEVQQNWYELAELLLGVIDRPRDEGQLLESRLRLAKIREQHLEDMDGAIEQYEQSLHMPGGELALTALERLVMDDAHREQIADILEPVYREKDWWQKLVVILDAKLMYAEEQARRGEMLREIAQIHEERGGDLGLALEALGKAWIEDINDDELYERFVSLGLAQGNTTLLVEVLEAGIKDQFDYDLVGKVLIRLSGVHETSRDDAQEAISCLRRLLEMTDDHALGLEELDRLLVGAMDWDALIPIVERRAELADELSERLTLLRRSAMTHENERSDRAAAIDAYRNILGAEEGDRDALDALDRLYTADENWAELAQVLLNKVETSEEPATQRALYFELAELQETKLGDTYEAISQTRSVLDLDPDDARALEGLSRLLEKGSMWQDLLEVVDHQATLASGPAEVDTAFTAAELVESKLLEVEAAIERYAGVLELDATHEGARAALLRHSTSEDSLERCCEVLDGVFRAEANFDALVKILETRLGAAEGDEERCVSLLAELAELHEMSRGDTPSAFATWSRGLKIQVDDERAQRELQRLAMSQGNWKELVTLYEGILAETLDSGAEYLCATKLGGYYEEYLGDLPSAAERYERALGVANEEGPALQALARIYEHDGKYSDLAKTYARQADATMDETEQANLLFMLGDVREQRLGFMADAVASYRDVLERDSSHGAARGALQRLLVTNEEERSDIIAILEPLYEQDGDSARLADLLSTKTGGVDDSFERAQIYARIAEIAEQELGDATRALDAVGGWLAEEPDSEQALEELERLGEQVQRHGEVAARLDGICAGSASDEVRVRLGQCSARIKLDKLGDFDGALKNVDALLAIDKDDVKALDALQMICRQQGDWARLAQTQWHRAELSYEPSEKRGLLAETAHLRLQLEERDECIVAWRAVLDIDEADAEAQRELAIQYRGREAWDDLVEILKLSSRYATDGEVDRGLRTEVAQIYSEQIQDFEQGVDAWQAVLDLDPNDLAPLAALESLHRRREDFMAVQEVLLRRADAVDGNEARIAVFLRLSQVAEMDREAPEEAIDFLRSVLEIESMHLQANEQIERLLRSLERWHDVVELHQIRAEHCAIQGDVPGELRWLAQAAEVWEGQLDNPDEAAEMLEKILVRDPNSVAALTRLAKIYESASDWERCSEILERALALGPQGTDAADLYVRLGEVARNKDGDEAKAQEYFGQALHFDGYHRMALERIEEAARAKDDWLLVADMVRRRYEITEDPAQKLDLTVELAQLYGERLGQPEQVIPLLEAANQSSPDDPRIVGPLADLYFHAGRHSEAAPMFEQLADAAKKKRKMKDVASYKQKLAGIFHAQGDAEKAIAAYEEAFRVDPTNVRTMVGLGQLYMAKQDWEKARRVYRSMVLQNIDPAIGITKADVYFQLGQIHHAQDELPKAKDMYKRALSADSSHAQAKDALGTLG
ncbi:MAG: tetratricopeptide repeat protein [Myxococcales bacterium]|nr:tetratricopeptide repeat protein [Myxococcales bacterium]